MNDTHVVDTDLSVISQKYKKEADYWLKKLDGLDAGGFPFMERVGEQRFTETTFTLPAELSARLLNTAGNSDIRLHMILVTGLAILLHKYRPFKSDDISIGMPVYKQEQEGRFVNTVLALRNTVKEENSFKDLLLQFRQTITEAVEHQNYPVEILLKQLDLSPAKEKFPLFDTALLLENIHNREYLQHVNPNMVFMLNHEKDTITGTVTYNENRYTERTINQIIGHFTHLLQQASGDLDTRINDLTVLAEDGLKQLLQNFNRCLDDAKHESEFAHESTISQLFEDQVAKTPDAPAVVFEDDQLTYAQLNERADVAAQILVNKGVTPDTLVALMVEPSLETMVGILGIIKAGGAYLPIHHDTPTERLSVMLKDSGVYLLLTKNDLFKMHSYSTLQGLTRQEMTTFRTKPRPQITDFDSLSMPDRSLVNYEKYNRYIGHNLISNNLSLQATRGCPFKCAYCHKIWPKTHMVRSAEHVFDEIRFNNKLGIRRFSFVDDIFNFNRKNTIRFFRMIIDSDLDIDLFYHMRGDILTEDYIDLMVKAGLKRLALALETGCPRLQKKIGKNLNIEKLRHNMNYIATKYPQIILELYTMHGFPSETEEDAQMTMDFIKGIKWLHFPYIFILHIYPNTEMEKLALDSGIPPEAIDRSMNLAYHELPDTLPFDKSFTIKYQAEFLNEYFLLKERLVDVLPKQMEVLTESEIIQKYNSYLPADIDIRTFDDLLEFFNISRDELPVKECMEESRVYVPDLNTRLKNAYPAVEPEEGALRVLLLDLSQYFSQSDDQLGDLVEPPLGLMYLMTHLNNTFKEKIDGRIAKSMIDFDSFGEFRELLEKFKPQVIGIRTLSFYKDFFHQCVNKIREWGIEAPILTGGPYATSSYHTILQDPAVDLVVMGEGELTLEELIRRMMENGGQLPAEEELKEIEGIAFIPESQKTPWNHAREIITLDDLQPTARRATGPRHAGLGKATGGTSVQPHNLVYNIFTSGSTGRPKGVMLEHRNLSRLVYGLKKRIYDRYDGPLNIGLVASYIFDASIKQIFAALLGGHALHIVPENMRVDGA
ncbi:MAG: AMP-binding protein, partial [bacterium]|nr:AMP-binding protein [bacterium]